MVAVTRSKIKRPDVSSSTNQDARSSSGVNETTPLSPARVEIPKVLYEVITEAASIRESLRTTNKNDKGLRRNLYATESRVKVLATYFKGARQLPESWEYNHKTAISTCVPEPSKPLKKKKIKRKVVRLPTIDGTLNEEEQKVKKFVRTNKTKVHECLSIPMKTVGIAVNDPVVNLIHDFAVEAYNDSYHKYVNKKRDRNIVLARPSECKCYKWISEYYFFVTMNAIEQENHGVYEAAVICDPVTGARTLGEFVFKRFERPADRSLKYEEAWSSDSSGPDYFYNITGMVHRRRDAYRGSGFNYRNPSCDLFRFVLNDGKRRKAAPVS